MTTNSTPRARAPITPNEHIMITSVNTEPTADRVPPASAAEPKSAGKHKRRLAVAGISAMAVMAVSLSGTASAARSGCTFQTANGHYLTAVNGGGLALDAGGQPIDVIHTDAVHPAGWETFTLVGPGGGAPYGIQTANGHFLTAVGGGGRITDVIHSDATQMQGWEKFIIVKAPPAPGDPQEVYSIQTVDGHFLTAVDGGGRTTDTIHSDATAINGWEKFHMHCAN
jgi:hypothetical protein